MDSHRKNVAGFSIRRATAKDVESILAISNWAAAHTTANFALEPEKLADWLATFEKTEAHYPWVVAVTPNSEVIGFAKAVPAWPRGAYAWTAEVGIYIAEAWHRRGVARRLYEALLGTLRAQGFVTVLATVTAGHLASEALHEAFGFQRCATLHRVGWKVGAWHDVSFWELHLRGPEAPPPLRTVEEVWGASPEPAWVVDSRPRPSTLAGMDRLTSCHRRIEERLAELDEAANAGRVDDGLLDDVIGFHDRSIVRHEADEERSLFPRLARVPEARGIQAKLVDEHRAQEELWTRLRNLSPDAKSDIASLTRELRASYTRHVAVEEEQLFPLAEAQLSDEEWDAIAQEIESRRGGGGGGGGGRRRR